MFAGDTLLVCSDNYANKTINKLRENVNKTYVQYRNMKINHIDRLIKNNTNKQFNYKPITIIISGAFLFISKAPSSSKFLIRYSTSHLYARIYR